LGVATQLHGNENAKRSRERQRRCLGVGERYAFLGNSWEPDASAVGNAGGVAWQFHGNENAKRSRERQRRCLGVGERHAFLGNSWEPIHVDIRHSRCASAQNHRRWLGRAVLAQFGDLLSEKTAVRRGRCEIGCALEGSHCRFSLAESPQHCAAGCVHQVIVV